MDLSNFLTYCYHFVSFLMFLYHRYISSYRYSNHRFRIINFYPLLIYFLICFSKAYYLIDHLNASVEVSLAIGLVLFFLLWYFLSCLYYYRPNSNSNLNYLNFDIDFYSLLSSLYVLSIFLIISLQVLRVHRFNFYFHHFSINYLYFLA